MKVGRQEKVLEIIQKYPIETQEDLAVKLKESGFNVTQATISRDIKELNLIKVQDENNNYKYSQFKDDSTENNRRIVNVFKESVINVDFSGTMIVLKTLSGTAMAASAAIDSMSWSDIVGCVAGDDTIFVLVRLEENVGDIVNRFRKMMRH